MKNYTKKIILLFLVVALFGCSKDKFNNNNPYIPNRGFSVVVNLNLPSYSNLQFAGNAAYVNDLNAGIRGVIVFNTGGAFLAYDAACPNQFISSCSTLEINGIMAKCPCDDAEYNLFTGQSPGKEYPLKQYRVEVSGTLITIFN